LNDILIGYGNYIGIYYQTNAGTFNEIKSFSAGIGVTGLKTGDLNNDGLTDFAVSNSNDYIKIFIQNADGSFKTNSVTVKSANPSELDIADVNGDNLDDIIYMASPWRQTTLQIIYQQPGVGITNTVVPYVYPGEYYPNFEGIGIGDLNNDGRNDIAGSYGSNGESVVILFQDQSGQIGNDNLRLPAYSGALPVEIADLNCDGNNEIIVGHWEKVSIYEKNASNQFKDFKTFNSTTNYYPYSLAVGDLNNDNKKDIVTGGDWGTFAVLYNTSQPTKFIKIDSYTENESKTLDTASIKSILTTPIIDPSASCKVNRVLKETIITTTKREYYSGDSISIRYYSLCNPAASDTIRKHFNVTINYEPTIVSTKDTINTDELSASLSKMTINREENSYIFSIYSNICWKLSTDQDWLDLSAIGGSGNTPITVTAKENPSLQPRTAIITLSGAGMQDIPITVTQKGIQPYLNTSTATIDLKTYTNDTTNFDISSNINWTISSNASWLMVDKATGKGDNQIILTAQANNTNITRHGTLTISGADTIQRIIVITQPAAATLENGAVIQIEVYPNPSWGFLNVIFSDASMEGTIDIYNIPGVKLLSQNFTRGISNLDIDHLQPGIYLLSVQTSVGVITRKIVKK
jgi:hypothetical protein